MRINSRYAPNVDGGTDVVPDAHAQESMERSQRCLWRARSRGTNGNRTTIASAVREYIDARERRAFEDARNTGQCRVLMKEGVWLVPEDERPKPK